MTPRVREILSWYSSDNPGTKANLARVLNQGKLAGTGRLLMLPVDQGWEHGPVRSFLPNPPSHDPVYHAKFALEAGMSAYVAPLGFLEAVANEYAGQIPLILKLSNSDSLRETEDPQQSVTASVEDALRLGCAGIGYTIYPGSSASPFMYESLRDLIAEAKRAGLFAMVWSYPRGGSLSAEGETAIDVISYAAHIACQLGAHIVKVKLPTSHIEIPEAEDVIEREALPIATVEERVRYVVQACFAGKRIVVFSGGEEKEDDELLEEVREIRDGGGNGSIMGRNCFKREREDAMRLVEDVLEVYGE